MFLSRTKKIFQRQPNSNSLASSWTRKKWLLACLPINLRELIKTFHVGCQKKILHSTRTSVFNSTLQFACRVVVPGRAFLQRMINLTRGRIEPHYHIKLNSSFRKDVAMCLVFLEQWNGTNIFIDLAPTNSPEFEFSTDASGSLGYGAFFSNF
jgi:hypothetical protein